MNNEYEKELELMSKQSKNEERNATTALRAQLQREKNDMLHNEKDKFTALKEEKLSKLKEEHENINNQFISKKMQELDKESLRECEGLRKMLEEEQRARLIAATRVAEGQFRTTSRSIRDEYSRLEEIKKQEISRDIEIKTEELKRELKEKNMIAMNQLKNDSGIQMKRALETCRSQLATESEREKQNVIREMVSVEW